MSSTDVVVVPEWPERVVFSHVMRHLTAFSETINYIDCGGDFQVAEQYDARFLYLRKCVIMKLELRGHNKFNAHA